MIKKLFICTLFIVSLFPQDNTLLHDAQKRIMTQAPEWRGTNQALLDSVILHKAYNVNGYSIYEPASMKSESLNPKNNTELSNNKYIFNIGLGSQYNLNFIGITRNLKMSNDGVLFITCGLGLHLLGVGFTTNNQTGVNVSAGLGLDIDSYGTINGTVSYSYALWTNKSINFGIAIGTNNGYYVVMPVIGLNSYF